MKNVQTAVQQLFDRLISENKETGLQAAVFFRGELVAHSWAGVADPGTNTAVDARTLFPVFSSGKGVTATLMHRLVERGVLAYDQAIASVWPEFAANGKEGVTLRHALNHTAGLQLVPAGIGYGKLCDWNTMCAAIAAMKPEWAPGSQREYHAITFGWILGEMASRATGKGFEQLLEEEIRAPLGLTDMFMGLPADRELEARVAWLEERGPLGDFPVVDFAQAIPNWVQPLYTFMNRDDVRQTCIPASNGIMTAHDLAKHYAALCPSGVDGVELLPPSRVLRAVEVLDSVHATPTDARGLGYNIGHPESVMGKRPTCFGHGGYGGSLGFADADNRLAIGFARNRLRDPDGVDTAKELVAVVRAALGVEA